MVDREMSLSHVWKRESVSKAPSLASADSGRRRDGVGEQGLRRVSDETLKGTTEEGHLIIIIIIDCKLTVGYGT